VSLRTKRIVLACIPAVSLVVGLMLVLSPPLDAGALEVGIATIDLALIFVWLRYDERETAYRRSALFNIGIAGLAIFFIPVYFFRARPSGSRARPMLGSFGILLLCYVMMVVGAVLARLALYFIYTARPS
jgi:hypothetical protein